MRKSIGLIILLLALNILFIAPAQAATPTITLLNPPPSGVLELAVGETYVFDILVTSDEVFTSAAAMPDQFFPGKGIFYHGGDRVLHATTATLHLTITGKGSTADLPDGVAPASVVVAVRYGGNDVVVEIFDFVVVVN